MKIEIGQSYIFKFYDERDEDTFVARVVNVISELRNPCVVLEVTPNDDSTKKHVRRFRADDLVVNTIDHIAREWQDVDV